MGSLSLSVVIPVYDSASTLPELVRRVDAAVGALGREFELVLVNDGSPDESGEVLASLARDNVRVIELMRNYGQHNALLAGIHAAQNEVVITLDDDLQNPPEEIGRLLAKLDEGFDVVYGTSEERSQSLWRVASSRLTKFALQSAMGAETARNVSAFRAFRTELRGAFSDYQSAFVSIDVLLTWGTTQFGSVSVENHARKEGESHYTFWKLCTHAMNMLTGFSTVPLQIASWTGFAFTLFGFGVLVWTLLGLFLHGRAVPGFAFLASIVALFSGAQLFALGVIGEYLARMHFRLMGKPPFVVRKKRP